MHFCALLINLLQLGLSPSASSHSYSAIIVPLVVYALLYTSPAMAQRLATSPTKHDISISLISMMFSAVVLGLLVFTKHPQVSDCAVAGLLCYGETHCNIPRTLLTECHRYGLKQRSRLSSVAIHLSESDSASILEVYTREPGIKEDILFSSTEHVLHARTNAVRYLDK